MKSRQRVRQGLIWLSLLGGLGVLPPAAQAHNPDTSYARIQISEEAVTLRLTYDLFTLQKIAALDADSDGHISRGELETGTPRLRRFLDEHLTIEVNETSSELGKLTSVVWPPEMGESIAEKDWHTASGLIHFNFARPAKEMPESVTVTFDFTKLSERHTVLGAFIHEAQEEEVIFNRFEPDYLYFTGYETPLSMKLLRFMKLGVEHIFHGYDHLCFLLALIVVSRFGELVKIVTAFTLAHSLTLILATLGIVNLPGRLVESAIALTIVYVALENIWKKKLRQRWVLAFGFGLVHGFGFAGVLRELGLPETSLMRCLISFNVGVELGQIAIVAVFLPLTWWLARWQHGRTATVFLSVILALFGTAWFADRVLALGWMPF